VKRKGKKNACVLTLVFLAEKKKRGGGRMLQGSGSSTYSEKKSRLRGLSKIAEDEEGGGKSTLRFRRRFFHLCRRKRKKTAAAVLLESLTRGKRRSIPEESLEVACRSFFAAFYEERGKGHARRKERKELSLYNLFILSQRKRGKERVEMAAEHHDYRLKGREVRASFAFPGGKGADYMAPTIDCGRREGKRPVRR